MSTRRFFAFSGPVVEEASRKKVCWWGYVYSSNDCRAITATYSETGINLFDARRGMNFAGCPTFGFDDPAYAGEKTQPEYEGEVLREWLKRHGLDFLLTELVSAT